MVRLFALSFLLMLPHLLQIWSPRFILYCKFWTLKTKYRRLDLNGITVGKVTYKDYKCTKILCFPGSSPLQMRLLFCWILLDALFNSERPKNSACSTILYSVSLQIKSTNKNYKISIRKWNDKAGITKNI